MTCSELSYSGRWWYPEEPNKAYFSRIVLDSKNQSRLETVPEYSCITRMLHGILTNGEKATLSRKNTNDLKAQWMELFVGTHLESTENLYITQIRISFLETHTSSNLKRFSVVPEAIDPLINPKPWPEHTKFRKKGIFSDPEISMTVSIENPSRLIWKDFNGQRIQTVNYHADPTYLVLQTNKPVLFEELKEHALKIQDFVSFALGRAAIVDKVQIQDSKGTLIQYFGKWACSRDHVKGLALTNSLFSLREINLDVALEGWYLALEKFYPAPQVITYRYYGSGFLEHDLSASVSALENLYNQLNLPQIIKHDEPDGAEEVRKILQSASMSQARNAAYKAVRSRKIKVPLKNKLHKLVARLPNTVSTTLNFNFELWIDEVKEQRDDVSHTASHVTEQSNLARMELEKSALRTRIILILVIMQESGFSESAIDEAVQNLKGEQSKISWPNESSKNL